MSFSITEKEWRTAEYFLKEAEDGTKLPYSAYLDSAEIKRRSRKHKLYEAIKTHNKQNQQSEPLAQTLHSFIKIECQTFGIAQGKTPDAVIGQGIYGVVKYLIDKQGNISVIKLEKNNNLNQQLEAKILQDRGLSLGKHQIKYLPISQDKSALLKKNKYATQLTYLGKMLTKDLIDPLSDNERLDLAIQLCLIVHDMHVLGRNSKTKTTYAHFDIKPENITWDKTTNQLHLIDWGFAQPYTTTQYRNTSESKGTPLYMPYTADSQLTGMVFDMVALKRTLYLPAALSCPFGNVNDQSKPYIHNTTMLLPLSLLNNYHLFNYIDTSCSLNSDENSNDTLSASTLAAILINVRLNLGFNNQIFIDDIIKSLAITELYQHKASLQEINDALGNVSLTSQIAAFSMMNCYSSMSFFTQDNNFAQYMLQAEDYLKIRILIHLAQHNLPQYFSKILETNKISALSILLNQPATICTALNTIKVLENPMLNNIIRWLEQIHAPLFIPLIIDAEPLQQAMIKICGGNKLINYHQEAITFLEKIFAKTEYTPHIIALISQVINNVSYMSNKQFINMIMHTETMEEILVLMQLYLWEMSESLLANSQLARIIYFFITKYPNTLTKQYFMHIQQKPGLIAIFDYLQAKESAKIAELFPILFQAESLQEIAMNVSSDVLTAIMNALFSIARSKDLIVNIITNAKAMFTCQLLIQNSYEFMLRKPLNNNLCNALQHAEMNEAVHRVIISGNEQLWKAICAVSSLHYLKTDSMSKIKAINIVCQEKNKIADIVILNEKRKYVQIRYFLDPWHIPYPDENPLEVYEAKFFIAFFDMNRDPQFMKSHPHNKIFALQMRQAASHEHRCAIILCYFYQIQVNADLLNNLANPNVCKALYSVFKQQTFMHNAEKYINQIIKKPQTIYFLLSLDLGAYFKPILESTILYEALESNFNSEINQQIKKILTNLLNISFPVKVIANLVQDVDLINASCMLIDARFFGECQELTPILARAIIAIEPFHDKKHHKIKMDKLFNASELQLQAIHIIALCYRNADSTLHYQKKMEDMNVILNSPLYAEAVILLHQKNRDYEILSIFKRPFTEKDLGYIKEDNHRILSDFSFFRKPLISEHEMDNTILLSKDSLIID